MIAEAAAAAMVGVSFSNSWVCLLLSLGARAHSKKMAASFIAGRFMGILVLGTIFALFGVFVDIPTRYYSIVFAVLTLVFAGYIFLRHVLPGLTIVNKWPVLKKICLDCPSVHGSSKPRSNKEHAPTTAEDCNSSCSDCSKCSKKTDISTKGGLIYGLLRGATPCLKMLILAPLLITTTLPTAFIILVVFAVTSSAYPLIGFLAGGIITQVASLKRSPTTMLVMNAFSMFVLLGLGIYYVYKFFFMETCSAGGA